MAECRWCTRNFELGRGGSAGRFCCSRHRVLFWGACRRWAEPAVTLGLMSIADLKAAATACTPRSGGISPPTAPEVGSEVDALGALLRDILDALSVDELAELPEVRNQLGGSGYRNNWGGEF
jgi:hypothetical protein